MEERTPTRRDPESLPEGGTGKSAARRELHQDALSGALGRDRQELARHVEAGRTTWGEAFEGYSAYSTLLTDHLTRQVTSTVPVRQTHVT